MTLSVTVLGSGGNSPIPTPTCGCRVCERAREVGVPHARHGNSLYIEELSAMVDAPEFVYENLEREAVDDLEYIFLTHWHPDHAAGLRVVQSRSMERMFEAPDHGLIETARSDRPTLVTTRRVYERTCELYDGLRHFVEDIGFADTHFLDGDPLTVGDARIAAIPYSLSGDGDLDATAFVVERGDATVVLAVDDARHLEEAALPDDIDLAVFECGYFRETPDGTRILTEVDDAIMSEELTHEEVMARVERVDADRTVLTEIEHLYGRTYDDFSALESTDGYEGVEFAYDGLQFSV
ncbi:MBL fold metallo-hydrolase [Natronomonas sp. CBA1123]|jgi:phosphoribosyl 1,2-cyclic phosphate phosphodiesterase|uniref:MBL fold metallo-hydrolase n=1 Tax=Natronomonas sp. CBA1123 TaxID=2668070 RepID=UPI0012EA035F|nr:MBL fold metallo-hydrolase [Natronomonas sp. CBA1123]MUV85836.1 MBL fold metallo-hydrolase [Natronomonas sp. CBA1123]